MNSKLILIGAVGVLLAGSLYLTSASKEDVKEIPEQIHGIEATVVISMKDLKYSETQVTIKQGDTVKFVNAASNTSEEYWPASNIHPSHGIYPEFDPARPLKPGESWSFKFDRVGIWKFHDHLHPKEIKGEIVVE